MLKLLRFIALVLAGSAGGFYLFSLLLNSRPGRVAFEPLALAGAMLGGYAGIACELALRLGSRRRWRFSIAELLAATTLSVALLAMAILIRGAQLGP